MHDIDEQPATVIAPPSTRVHLEWEAASAPALFPLMKADLLVYPLTATETQLDFSGRYEPPLGWLGSAVNATVGHCIAEASVTGSSARWPTICGQRSGSVRLPFAKATRTADASGGGG